MNEDILLVQRALNSKEHMNQLFNKHYSFLYSYALKLTCNKEQAEDLVQDTIIKAIEKLASYKGKAMFSTWLISIANNTYKNSFRSKFKQCEIDEAAMVSSFNLENDYIKKEQFLQVMHALKNIKPKQKIPFILKHYYGYSYDEIAKILKVPIGTVRSRIHYTIKQVQGRFI